MRHRLYYSLPLNSCLLSLVYSYIDIDIDREKEGGGQYQPCACSSAGERLVHSITTYQNICIWRHVPSTFGFVTFGGIREDSAGGRRIGTIISDEGKFSSSCRSRKNPIYESDDDATNQD